MIIGTPKEIKDSEHRIALTPFAAEPLNQAGHTVVIEAGAGVGSGFTDGEYEAAGARVEADAARVWASDLVLKVKEPLPSEYAFFREDLLLFTYLHLAAEPKLTEQLVKHHVTAIAYETVQEPGGALPILTPMSEVAGRMAPQVAAQLLTHMQGGRGKLLGGVPGVAPGRVVVLGAGTVGTHAARIALGLGAEVAIFDINLGRLRNLDLALHGRVTTRAASPPTIEEAVRTADVVIGAVLVPGAKAPVLVTDEMVQAMPDGSVIVDVAVDQGGCVQTIHPTAHSNPTYTVHGVVHYGVTNMPGAVPRTSTIALTNASLPYVGQLAREGFIQAVRSSPALAAGVNTYQAAITRREVAEALNHDYVPLDGLMRARPL
jgi:alanine dehydrogenase